MKFTAKVSDLRPSLDLVAKAIQKSAIPVLECIIIDAAEKVSLRICNLDIEVVAQCEGIVSKPGIACVDGSTFRSFIATLPATSIIEMELASDLLTMRCGRARCSLRSIDPADMPSLTTEGRLTHQFTVQTGEFRRLLEATRYAISNEITRFYLNGAYLHTKHDRLVSVSTNGHILARASIDIPLGAKDMHPVIIPARTIDFLLDATRKSEDGLLIDCGESIFCATIGSLRLVSKVIDGTFPDYERIIPERAKVPIIIVTDDMIDALSRVSSAAGRADRWVVLESMGRDLVLSATGEHGDIEDSFEPLSGELHRVAFNPSYLRETVEALNSKTVSIYHGDADRAAIFVGSESRDGDMALIMPRRR